MSSNIIIAILIMITFYCLFDGYYRKNQIEKFEANLLLDNPIAERQKVVLDNLNNLENGFQIDKELIAGKLRKKLDLDADGLSNINFKNDQEGQNNRLKELSDYLAQIKSNTNKANVQLSGFKSIKSIYNGQPLNLIPVFNNDEELIGYQVVINGKCLAHTSTGLTNLTPCSQTDINQYFELKDIYSSKDLNTEVEKDHIEPSDPDIFKYPHILTKSFTSGNCLTNHDGSLSVEVCSPRKDQQWKASIKEVSCMET